jgi:rod shape determining protein RodA
VASNLFVQQLISFILGWLIILSAAFFDVRPIFKHRFFVMSVYFMAIFLLVATLFLAPSIRQTKSWIVIGPIQFQTSEFAKLALIVTLAYFFAKRHVGIAYIKNILIPLAYLAVPLVLILKQPDLGSGLILVGLFVGFLFFSGLRPQHLVLGIILAVFFSLWAWGSFLKPYQKERIEALFYPTRDPLGINYNTIQSKIAIGSGGFFGKGFRQGTEVQLKFLPEAQTDFIFAAIMEEWGLLGGIIVLVSFLKK